jgi:dephospho-CoA kinase
MLVIGLTGGIASGKSMAGHWFNELGISVIDFDVLARDVVAVGEPLLEKIFAMFGEDFRLPDGQLNRRLLRERIFANPSERIALQKLLHPAIRAKFLEQLARITVSSEAPYVVAVIPLLIESQLQSWVDKIVVVDCDEALQIKRCVARDGQSALLTQQILNAQVSRGERLAAAHYVLTNNTSPENLHQQVLTLDHRLREGA